MKKYSLSKEKGLDAEVTKVYSEDKPIHEMVKKGKASEASFAVVPQTAKVTASVHDKFLVKTEKADHVNQCHPYI